MCNCREVEDFARRLNCVWPERMQEIRTFDQESRRLLPVPINGAGSLKRYTGVLQFIIAHTLPSVASRLPYLVGKEEKMICFCPQYIFTCASISYLTSTLAKCQLI